MEPLLWLALLFAASREANADIQPPTVRASVLDEHTLEYNGHIFLSLDAGWIDGVARRGLQEAAFEPYAPPPSPDKPMEHLQRFSTEWWLYIICAVSCVVSAAFAAGLTMGLVALDPMQVRALASRLPWFRAARVDALAHPSVVPFDRTHAVFRSNPCRLLAANHASHGCGRLLECQGQGGA